VEEAGVVLRNRQWLDGKPDPDPGQEIVPVSVVVLDLVIENEGTIIIILIFMACALPCIL
jgi:hypothetical protein